MAQRVMKILIVSQYYYPEQFQINEIAPELVRRGHSVTVLCGTPNYPGGDIFPGYEKGANSEEVISGVRVIRVRQKPRGHNPISLVLNYRSYVKEANRYLKNNTEDYDVVLGYQLSPITSMLPAFRFARDNNIPLLLYVLDIWPVSAQSHLPIKNGLIYRWLRVISRRIYNAAGRVLVTSRPFIDYLNKINHVHLDKIGYLPQHADDSMLYEDLANKHSATTNFMFAGNLGAGAALDVIIKAASMLNKSLDYKIHFVGDGSQRQKLEEMVRESGLTERIEFHGQKMRAEMPRYYQMADALLITLRGNNEVGNTMPGKLQMYMTTGKTILGAINGAANEVIKESGCGKCVNAGDTVGLAKIMEHFIFHRENYLHCGKNARRYFKDNFTLEKFMNALEKELLILCKNGVQKTY